MTAEKKGHFLDLKIPLGGLLTFYGLILIVFGLLSNKEIYQKSLGININLVWGVLILIVGGLLLLAALAKPRQGRMKTGPTSGSNGPPAG